MADEVSLVKTLDFQLDIRSGNKSLLREAVTEARDAYNETVRLAKANVEQQSIAPVVADRVDLVKNTTQRIVSKALDAVQNARAHDDVSEPNHTKTGPYPLRMNYEEGYTLDIGDDDELEFRISAKPYRHVTGVLKGDSTHHDILKSALVSDEWRISTAEALLRDGQPELHVTVGNTEQTVRDVQSSQTVIGIDVNEDNVGLTALSHSGVEDTLVIDFPEIKFQRHRHLTIRKRVERAEKSSIFRTLRGKEKRFVRDRVHKVSRHIVEWCQQFESPCIVFEDLEGTRDSIDYGARMNHRLHHLPFRAIQFYTSYKAAFEGIPTAWIDPEYTSQRCPLCSHTERSNRDKKRFKCRACDHQDHADRNASINIAMKGVKKHQCWNVPALNSLPQVRKVRRRASGRVDRPTVTHGTDRGHHTDGVAGVSD